MTLQTGVVFHDGVRLWTDTAFRNAQDGTLALVGHGPKAFVSTPLFEEGGLPNLHFAGVISSCGGDPTPAMEAIGRGYPMNAKSLLKASAQALRDYTADGQAAATLLLAVWDERPRMFFISSYGLPGGALRAFEPIERTAWFQPAPDCPAYSLGMAEGFTPQLAHDAVMASLATPYENGLDGRSGRWIAGNIIKLTVTAAGASQRIVREGIPDAEGVDVECRVVRKVDKMEARSA